MNRRTALGLGPVAVLATADGVTKRYVDAPLTDVLPDDAFVDYVCRAVTGG